MNILDTIFFTYCVKCNLCYNCCMWYCICVLIFLILSHICCSTIIKEIFISIKTSEYARPSSAKKKLNRYALNFASNCQVKNINFLTLPKQKFCGVF